jgi:hypothetical protein
LQINIDFFVNVVYNIHTRVKVYLHQTIQEVFFMKKIITALLALATVLCMIPALAVSAAPAITVDGDLSDWAGTHTLSVVGSGEWEGKKVTIYGVLAEEGLYLAADAYHTKYITDKGNWWENTNFEFFVGNGNLQGWVSSKGMSDTNTAPSLSNAENGRAVIETAVMKTESAPAGYHTVVELFVKSENLPAGSVQDNGSIRVGVAWKTVGDINNNGEANGGGNDEYWVPKLTWPNNNDKAHVTANGIFNRNGEALENTEVVGAKEATESEEGYTGDTVCKDCGAVVAKGETIPAKTPATPNPAPTGDVLNVALAVSVAMLILASVIVAEKRKIHE